MFVVLELLIYDVNDASRLFPSYAEKRRQALHKRDLNGFACTHTHTHMLK